MPDMINTQRIIKIVNTNNITDALGRTIAFV